MKNVTTLNEIVRLVTECQEIIKTAQERTQTRNVEVKEMIMSIAQRSAETVRQNQSEATMRDYHPEKTMLDEYKIVLINALEELKAARDFIFEIRRLDYLPLVANALKQYDEAKRGGDEHD
jgi:hypothetical protein